MAGLEDDLADEVRPSRQSPVDDEVFDASDDDDMAGFIDDDVGSEGQRRQRRAKPKGLPKGVSSQAMLVCSWPIVPFQMSSRGCLGSLSKNVISSI